MMSKLSKKKVFIAIPCRDAVAKNICGDLSKVLNHLSCSKDYITDILLLSGTFPYHRTRNIIVDKFLKTDYEYLLMIDDDIIPPLNILDMTKHQKKIIGGLCYAWNQQKGVFSVIYKKESEKSDKLVRVGIGKNIENKGIIEANLIGSGCIMIHRSVFKKIPKPYFKIELDINDLILINTEDFYFCQKAQLYNYKIYVDTDKVCGHIKNLDLKNVGRIMQKKDIRLDLLNIVKK